MRWDKVFNDLDLQWEREADNARWDEEQENARALRSRMSFHDVLVAEHQRTGALSVVIRGVEAGIHVVLLGDGWIDGVVCGSEKRIVAALSTIRCVDQRRSCQCTVRALMDLEHITLGIVLRQAERRRDSVSVLGGGGPAVGRVTAVWSDSFRLEVRGSGSLVVPFRETVALVAPGP